LQLPSKRLKLPFVLRESEIRYKNPLQTPNATFPRYPCLQNSKLGQSSLTRCVTYWCVTAISGSQSKSKVNPIQGNSPRGALGKRSGVTTTITNHAGNSFSLRSSISMVKTYPFYERLRILLSFLANTQEHDCQLEKKTQAST